MKINEIFYSIQGEGKYTGKPTGFIRLSECNLSCPQCDTKYANEGTPLSIDAVVSITKKRIPEFCKNICITGGEPLLQMSDLELLLEQTYFKNKNISIETNGTLFPSSKLLSNFLIDYVPDWKCPSSEPKLPFNTDWLKFYELGRVQLKFVVFNIVDLLYVKSQIPKINRDTTEILISPGFNLVKVPEAFIIDVSNRIWMQEVVEFAKDNYLRYSLQIHKIIWGNKIGV